MSSSQSVAKLATPLTVGSVSLPNRVFLAPMSGVSDRPFREIAASFGAGAVVSEMVASEMLARGDAEAGMRAEKAGEGPHIIQLAGREARWMAEGAKAATDAGADIIDINMGCPAKKVTGGYSGSALMRDLDHALMLIEATVSATDVPVTLKMRLGWDEESINAPELARRAESAGVRMITVHGRTRCQFYKGTADWDAIRAVREQISIPLIANGDLTDGEQMQEMLDQSGADGVMVGRGSYGRPWMAGHMAQLAETGAMPKPPQGDDLLQLIVGHYEAMLAHYGERVGLRAARKHLGWYLEQAGAPLTARGEIMQSERPAEVIRLIKASLLAERKAA